MVKDDNMHIRCNEKLRSRISYIKNRYLELYDENLNNTDVIEKAVKLMVETLAENE